MWLRARELDIDRDLGDFSFNNLAAYANKFAHVEKLGDTGLLGLGYAFHLDATALAALLPASCASASSRPSCDIALVFFRSR